MHGSSNEEARKKPFYNSEGKFNSILWLVFQPPTALIFQNLRDKNASTKSVKYLVGHLNQPGGHFVALEQ